MIRIGPRVPRQDGFTLLEVLIALVVLGMLLVGLAQATQFGLLAWSRQVATLGERAELDAVDRALRHLVEQVDPGDNHDAPLIRGTDRSLEFTSELPQAAVLPSRFAEMRLLVDGARRLVLRWSPYIHATRFGPPVSPVDTVLAEGVDHLELAYWPRPAPGAASGWRGSWQAKELPALIRIRLVFVDQDHRHWPDIVAAPMRERPGR